MTWQDVAAVLQWEQMKYMYMIELVKDAKMRKEYQQCSYALERAERLVLREERKQAQRKAGKRNKK